MKNLKVVWIQVFMPFAMKPLNNSVQFSFIYIAPNHNNDISVYFKDTAQFKPVTMQLILIQLQSNQIKPSDDINYFRISKIPWITFISIITKWKEYGASINLHREGDIHQNSQTGQGGHKAGKGVQVTFTELECSIEETDVCPQDNYKLFSPKSWALQKSGQKSHCIQKSFCRFFYIHNQKKCISISGCDAKKNSVKFLNKCLSVGNSDLTLPVNYNAFQLQRKMRLSSIFLLQPEVGTFWTADCEHFRWL